MRFVSNLPDDNLSRCSAAPRDKKPPPLPLLHTSSGLGVSPQTYLFQPNGLQLLPNCWGLLRFQFSADYSFYSDFSALVISVSTGYSFGKAAASCSVREGEPRPDLRQRMLCSGTGAWLQTCIFQQGTANQIHPYCCTLQRARITETCKLVIKQKGCFIAKPTSDKKAPPAESCPAQWPPRKTTEGLGKTGQSWAVLCGGFCL